MTSRMAHIYSEADTQGPCIVLCEACIRADAWQYDDIDAIEWIDDDMDRRCYCCGQSNEAAA